MTMRHIQQNVFNGSDSCLLLLPPLLWRETLDATMDAIAVVIEKKLGELPLQIKRVPEQHVIEQLFPDRSDCSASKAQTVPS